MVQSDSKPLSGPQKMFLDHPAPHLSLDFIRKRKYEAICKINETPKPRLRNSDPIFRGITFIKINLNELRHLKKVQKFVLGVRKVVWNHSGPPRMHYKSFHRKKFFDFFSIFFKHFSKQFGLLLKDLSCTSRKKSIFFKNKPCMKNSLVENLDMVPYFTFLASLDVKSKFEKQVRF